MPITRINRSKEKPRVYTGYLTYQGIEFVFVFDLKELRLIPPKDLEAEVNASTLTMFHEDDTRHYVEEKYLKGSYEETEEYLIFIPAHNKAIARINSVLFIPLRAYLIKDNDVPFSQMMFESTELDYIFPSRQGFRSFASSQDGSWKIDIKPFEETQSSLQKFLCDKKEISVQFCISRNRKSTSENILFDLSSILLFTFEPTEDYDFIYRLYLVVDQFINYCCSRRNTGLPKAKLNCLLENRFYSKNAEFILLKDSLIAPEGYSLEEGRYIRQAYFEGKEGKLLEDIAQRTICLDHLPTSFNSGMHINTAQFLIIVVAFEWEYKRLCEIDEKFSEFNTGGKTAKDKKVALRKCISNTLEFFNDLISPFAEKLYSINDEKYDCTSVGERIGKQRNRFAHGDFSKDFIGLSLLDLILLKQVIYVIQLKILGVSDTSIKKTISNLFRYELKINS